MVTPGLLTSTSIVASAASTTRADKTGTSPAITTFNRSMIIRSLLKWISKHHPRRAFGRQSCVTPATMSADRYNGKGVPMIWRGVALALGGFGLINFFMGLIWGFNPNIWWIDVRFLPTMLGQTILFCGCAGLVCFGAGLANSAA